MKVKSKGTGVLIGELSEQTQVPAHQLRYYEAQGLLRPVRRANQYRDYGKDAPITVIQIRKLLEAGLSTEEIRFLQPCLRGAAPELEPCQELLAALRARQQKLEERINTLMSTRQALHDLIETTEQSTVTSGPSVASSEPATAASSSL